MRIEEIDYSSDHIQVLFQDVDVLVINKPAGLLSIPDGYHPELPTIRSILEPQHGRLWIVHRLDKDTSGSLILARNLASHKALNAQFEQRLVSKIYHAIIIGDPDWDETDINLPLRVNGDRSHRTVIAELTGKPALTQVKVLKRYPGFTLVHASPRTGYTHQIRAHFSAAGFPILGDKLYQRNIAVPAAFEKVIQRPALHSYQIGFDHPSSNERLKITAPHPVDFENAIISINSQI